METGSDLLHVAERWPGTVAGMPVEAENRFVMRCWTWKDLEDVAHTAGFVRVSALDPSAVGARSDRLVAVAQR